MSLVVPGRPARTFRRRAHKVAVAFRALDRRPPGRLRGRPATSLEMVYEVATSRPISIQVGIASTVNPASQVLSFPISSWAAQSGQYGSRTWCCELGGWCLGVAGVILLRNGRA